ncbi:DnaB-like helicase C-terminal domain-containing protein [Pararhizobium qamdonense]|uniref:DnaB-like helicase C-terminal domain-containing protein n=1 Tax=Pararhizobium qamdonense TaxID=3031126 RepID=UPI0023E18E10|nr:DnaB-like helicase C-terminal domain-containing protein [Pararhizobium qamdonense]
MSQAAVATTEDDDEAIAEQEAPKWEFDEGFQRKTLALFMRDTQFANRTKDLIDPAYFTNEAHGQLVSLIKTHMAVHKAVPDLRILTQILKDEKAKKRIREDSLAEIKIAIKDAVRTDLSNSTYVMEKVADFAKFTAMEQAILRSVELLQRGDFAGIEKLTKAALNVGLQDDEGDYHYFKEIEQRTQVREDWKAGKILKRGISTGYSEIDANLYHDGWGRRELSLLMGAAKAGKSLGLGEFTKNASLLGFNTAYLSCEVSKQIIADRLDANLADTAMRLLKDDPQTIKARIQAAEAKAGHLIIRDFASGTLQPNQVDNIIEKWRSEGITLDLLAIDYADIMAANYRSDNIIDNLRSIYIDIRAIAYKHDLALLSATQTNRSGAAAHTAKMTDVAEDFNKIRTADVVIGINATEPEKQSGEARLHWVASRNSEDGMTLLIRQDREKLKFLTKVMGRV